jgi:hypothetical protein
VVLWRATLSRTQAPQPHQRPRSRCRPRLSTERQNLFEPGIQGDDGISVWCSLNSQEYVAKFNGWSLWG